MSSYRMITLFLSKNNINGHINNFNETVSCHLSYYSLGHLSQLYRGSQFYGVSGENHRPVASH
jgi:hypothetical protein